MRTRNLVLLIVWLFCWQEIPTALGLTYLEMEQMVKAGMTLDLIQAQVERENAYFTFDEIIYLKERKLQSEMVEFLMRYYLSDIPDIDVDFLIMMKAIPLDDEMINFLINRFGFEVFPLSPANIIALKEAKIDVKLIERLIRSKQ